MVIKTYLAAFQSDQISAINVWSIIHDRYLRAYTIIAVRRARFLVAGYNTILYKFAVYLHAYPPCVAVRAFELGSAFNILIQFWDKHVS